MVFRYKVQFLLLVLLSLVILACEKEAPKEEAKVAAAPQKAPASPKDLSKPPPAKAAPSLADLGAVYQKQAWQLREAISKKQADEAILKMAEGLTLSGRQLLPPLIKKYPACKAYLEAVDAVAATLKDLPLEAIERDYHKDAKLPRTAEADCYHGKDLVVHPATVAAMAKKGIANDQERKSAEHEITEVLAHLTVVTR